MSTRMKATLLQGLATTNSFKVQVQSFLHLPAFERVNGNSLPGARELLMRHFIWTSGGRSHATLQSLQISVDRASRFW